jgi:hypothetical protein
MSLSINPFIIVFSKLWEAEVAISDLLILKLCRVYKRMIPHW